MTASTAKAEATDVEMLLRLVGALAFSAGRKSEGEDRRRLDARALHHEWGKCPAPARRHARASGSVGRAVATIHGDRDTTVNPVNGDQVIAQSKAAANLRTTVTTGEASGGIRYTCAVQTDENGRSVLEQWVLHGAGHAWSGGSIAGSYTEPRGPDASREMMRFFLQCPPAAASRRQAIPLRPPTV